MEFSDLCSAIYEVNKSNGWDVTVRSDFENNKWKISGKIALIHSEIVELHEAWTARRAGEVAEEFADVAIRSMDLMWPLLEQHEVSKVVRPRVSAIYDQHGLENADLCCLHMHSKATKALEALRANAREMLVVYLWDLVWYCSLAIGGQEVLIKMCAMKNLYNASRGQRHGGKAV